MDSGASPCLWARGHALSEQLLCTLVQVPNLRSRKALSTHRDLLAQETELRLLGAVAFFFSLSQSTFLSLMTSTASEAASYEFTTLTCIPGVIEVSRLCRAHVKEGCLCLHLAGAHYISIWGSCPYVGIPCSTGPSGDLRSTWLT